MKKTVSINISGIIFHIEEDGYEKLKQYLAAIQRYFSTYEDGAEITSDIENRIAEIFAGKLGAGKQVITSEDVDALVATMGDIPDFEAVADDESGSGRPAAPASAAVPPPASPKRLYRDLSRKVLGGVCSGIAAYFEIDPVWIRLLFVGTLLDLFFLPGSFSGTALVAYIVLWIVVPGSGLLPDSKAFKKLYRNPDNRTIGGVCGGLAAYFNAEITLVRLLFVLSVLFFGGGILLYIVLWISMPEAKSLTEKMEMQGEPVTLSNIEANVKKNIQGDPDAPENTLTRIVLFPFRALAAVFGALGRVLGPLAGFILEAVRIFAALVVVGLAMALLFAALITLGVGLGWNAPENVVLDGMPLVLFSNTFPPLGWLAAFLVLAVPAVALGIAGLSLLTKRIVVNQPVGWTLFGLWMLGVLGISVLLPRAAGQFRREGSVEVARDFTTGGRGLYLDCNELDEDWNKRATLELEGYSGAEPRLEQRFTARGATREQARRNARTVTYTVAQRDTVLVFDSHFEFASNAAFHRQQLRNKLYIPYGRPFRMDPQLHNILENTLYRNGYSEADLNGNTFQFTANDGLVCLTCTAKKDVDTEEFYANRTRRDYRNFTRLAVRGPFRVIVEQDERYRVAVEGDQEAVDDVEFDQDGDRLEIRWRREFFKWQDWNWEENQRVVIRITMPNPEELDFSGATSFDVRNFDNLGDVEIKVSAGARGEAEVEADELKLEATSAGQLAVRGSANRLEAEANSAGRLQAFELEAREAEADASSGGAAEVNVAGRLEAKASSGGRIRYRGDARVQGRANSGGSIEKEGPPEVEKEGPPDTQE